MLRATLVAAMLAIASPALSEECRPTSLVLSRLAEMRATHVMYDGDAVRRAVRIYAAMPPAGPEPQADHIIVADLPTGTVMLLFQNGARICATMIISDTRTAAMAKQFILGIEI
jgi:hypothetical protein